jgi:diguanylate cyclase (GGDEF)-like protein/PAS domain S-box-containing protein
MRMVAAVYRHSGFRQERCAYSCLQASGTVPGAFYGKLESCGTPAMEHVRLAADYLRLLEPGRLLTSKLPTPSIPNGSKSHHLLATAGLMIVALTIFLGGVLFSSYRDVMAREETNLQNLAGAFASQVHYATRALELYIHNAEPELLKELGHRSALPQDNVDDEVASDEMVKGMYLFGPDGKLVARHFARSPALPPSLPANRQAGGHPEITISNVDHKTGAATISLTRAIYDKAKRRIGTVVLESDSTYFQHIFSSADLGQGGSVTLLHRDGTMLARGPTIPGAIGHSFASTPLFKKYLPAAPSGAFSATSPMDGVERVYGYSSVDSYPLAIITGRDKADTMRVWTRWFWAAIFFWAAFSLILLLFSWRIRREVSRQSTLIGQLVSSEARLAQGSRYLKSIIDALPTPLWVLDLEQRVLLFNKAFRNFVRGEEDQLVGRPEVELLGEEGRRARAELYRQALSTEVHALESELRNGAGEIRTVIQLSARLESDDNTTQIVNSLTDITERKQVELRLAYLSDFDPLTELPNQAQLHRMLQDNVSRGERVGVLIVALERLQEVTDLLGHDAGDEVIVAVAASLRRLASPCLCIARIQSDEFGFLLKTGSPECSIDGFALELHQLLSAPVRVRNREFYLAPVIGIALYPHDATSVNELLRLAEIAKHRARVHGGEPIQFHSESTHTLLNERLTIEEQLRRALERDELRAFYQPKVDIASGVISGFEVLLRWQNPTLGAVNPARFIPIAEHTGLIVPIGSWILRTACADAARWRRERGAGVKVAVNLSIRQFYQKHLMAELRDILAETGLPASCLELEITESIAMSRVDVVEQILGEIRELGVDLSIDDFGTGYSSLAYLKHFPVQRLKIDRAFIRDLGRDANSAAIVRSVVALGHGLGMRIVAEGVETQAQLDLLRELGCDEYQGFLFSRPVAEEEVTRLLQTWDRGRGTR